MSFMQANQKAWMSDPLENLDGEAVEKDVAQAYKVLYKMGKVRRQGSRCRCCHSRFVYVSLCLCV
jgi:hypothetical protein